MTKEIFLGNIKGERGERGKGVVGFRYDAITGNLYVTMEE